MQEKNLPYIKQQIILFVSDLYKRNCQPYLLYHNLFHTEFVVKKVQEIAEYYLLNETNIFILTAAAWFHDTGQLFQYGKNHEIKSVYIMRKYLLQRSIDRVLIDKIETCILATKIPHKPSSLLEEIMCDADTYNLGTNYFLITDELLKKEAELVENKEVLKWNEATLKFLESHKYFTSYCQTILNKGKQENITMLLARTNNR